MLILNFHTYPITHPYSAVQGPAPFTNHILSSKKSEFAKKPHSLTIAHTDQWTSPTASTGRDAAGLLCLTIIVFSV